MYPKDYCFALLFCSFSPEKKRRKERKKKGQVEKRGISIIKKKKVKITINNIPLQLPFELSIKFTIILYVILKTVFHFLNGVLCPPPSLPFSVFNYFFLLPNRRKVNSGDLFELGQKYNP